MLSRKFFLLLVCCFSLSVKADVAPQIWDHELKTAVIENEKERALEALAQGGDPYQVSKGKMLLNIAIEQEWIDHEDGRVAIKAMGKSDKKDRQKVIREYRAKHSQERQKEKQSGARGMRRNIRDR